MIHQSTIDEAIKLCHELKIKLDDQRIRMEKLLKETENLYKRKSMEFYPTIPTLIIE